MRYAGRMVNRNADLGTEAARLNAEFSAPLLQGEIAATIKSVEGYRERWSRRGWHDPRWLARQAARGRKGGRPRLYLPGLEPWTLEGVSRRTWERRRRDAKANTDKRGTPAPLPRGEAEQSAKS